MIARIKHAHSRLSPAVHGILWFITSSLCFAIMSALIHQLSTSGNIHPFVMVLFRNLLGAVVLLPFVQHHGGWRILKTGKLRMHMLRSLTGFVGMMLFFYALSVMPITDAIALSFTGPLFTTLLAIYLLKEKTSWQRWIALLIGFVGVLIILRPGFNGTGMLGILVILATSTWAISNIIIKKLARTEHPMVIVFYMTTIMVPFTIPFAWPYMFVPSLKEFSLLLGLAIVSVTAQFCLSFAYTKSDVSTLQPFDFFRLIFASIIGFFAFGELIDGFTFLGAVVIFTSSIYVTRHESRKRKRLEAAAGKTPVV